jgi:hypothetical protein
MDRSVVARREEHSTGLRGERRYFTKSVRLLRDLIGGERGIRTLAVLLESASYRFCNARVAIAAGVAVAPCTLLHAGRVSEFEEAYSCRLQPDRSWRIDTLGRRDPRRVRRFERHRRLPPVAQQRPGSISLRITTLCPTQVGPDLVAKQEFQRGPQGAGEHCAYGSQVSTCGRSAVD